MTDQKSLVGQRLEEQYQIIRRLGQGGMADVYLAQDLELDRQVAIKTMLPLVGENEELLARFRREARATAQLSHPNIIPVYTAGLTDAKQPYLVMQYIERGSLSEYLQELAEQDQWVSPIYALSLVRQIGDALHVAHEAGIVHRDLKPSNILLRDDGTPVLTDLGIAAVQQATTRLTQTNSLMGTPHYMSPEQGSTQPVDNRADIYSLGVILFELLAGQLPFDADSPWGIIHQHIYEPPPALSTLCTDLTAKTFAIVQRCLEKKPENRYPTAAALTEAIDAALVAEGATSQVGFGTWRPPTAPQTVAHPRTTRPSVPETTQKRAAPLSANRLYLVGGVAALALLLVAAFFFFSGREGSGEDESIVDAPTEAATLLPAANVAGDATSTVPLPTLTTLPTFTPFATKTITPTQPSSPPTPTAAIGSETRSAAGLLAFSCEVGGTNQIYLYDPETGRRTQLPNQPLNSIVPSFSPDGSQITYRSDVGGAWQIYVSDLEGVNRRAITDLAADNYEAVFSRDGGRFAFVSDADGDKDIYVMDVTGAGRRQLTFNEAYDDDPTWSPDGLIAYESNQDGRYNIYQISPAGGSPQLLASLGASSSTPAWSPDGDRIAFEVLSGGVRHIWTVDREGQNPTQVTFLGPDDQRPAWSPDGKKIAIYSNYQNADDTAYDIWIIDLTSQSAERITDSGGCYDPAWSRGASGISQEETAVACDLEIGGVATTGPAARFWSQPDVNAGNVTLNVREWAPLTVIDGPVRGPIQYGSEVEGWWWQFETEFGDQGWLWQERLIECTMQDE